jgi:hypothetical protein
MARIVTKISATLYVTTPFVCLLGVFTPWREIALRAAAGWCVTSLMLLGGFVLATLLTVIWED